MIIGEGPLQSEIKELIISNKAEHYIHVAGSVDDVYEYLRCSSVFVLPPYQKGHQEQQWKP